MKTKLKKFIPFAKVDNSMDPATGQPRREVWGIVTAERPDKDNEVCDYLGSLPYYKAVVEEMSKATDGKNIFPLRYMHQLEAVGKGIGVEFRDQDKEIFMGFKVVDDETWKLVDERVLTGFSQGGSIIGPMVEDPVFKGCRRYVADPSEVSLVDNPCLGDAHFAYVKSDGTVEMRKFLKVIPPGEEQSLRLKAVEAELSLLKVKVFGKATTKRVDGEDLTASAFLIVGDPDKTDTWKLPVEFSTDEKTESHLRNALARFNQLKDVPQDKKDAAWKRLVALCEKHGIDVDAEKAKMAAVHAWLRKRARIIVNRLSRKVKGGNVGYAVAKLDSDLGMLKKGLYEVGALATVVQELGWILYQQIAEEGWEGDEDSPLPDSLADGVDHLLDTLIQMVEEESEELREQVRAQMKA